MSAVIIGYARSPFHRSHKGALAAIRPEDIASQVIEQTIVQSGVAIEDIEDLMLGCAYPEGVQGLNLGRIVTFLSGLPSSIPGVTTNRLCGSSMQSIHDAAGAIAIGSGEVFLCGGVESMSLVKRGGWKRDLHPIIESEHPDAYINMGLTAENLAHSHSIARPRQEAFALRSHQKAAFAVDCGYFDSELISISGNGVTISTDGCIRADTTLERMASLPPAFLEDGSVTAATSSPLTDGSAFTVVCSEEYAESRGIRPMARILSTAVAGVPPEIMGIGPVPATIKALDRAGLGLDDINVIELNEAFSAQSLAVIEELDLSDEDERLNIDGGALAIGHPLGASGARITGKAASLLDRVGGDYALASMCIGGGMGISTILEKI
ncbi:MAG: thiolase family protein [Candidatus Poseidoniaceae archaeon]|jgi:acetyl-CoA acyltransferase|nr:thiolase family protein [Candidatus Poseidoniaceae archaeon]